MATRRMGLRHIEAFRAVILTGSMTEAARQLRTSQPQVSRLVGQLEEIARFPLFVRNGSRLGTTLEGSRFYRDVEKSFAGLENLEAAATDIRNFAADQLKVAAMPRLAGGLLTRIVVRFKADHPEVRVSIRSGTASSVNEWVKSGQCDAGLAMLYGEVADVCAETALSANCVAVLPESHALCIRKRLRPRDFEGEPFISFPAGSPLRARVDQVFALRKVGRKLDLETDLGSSACTLVAAGLGVSLVNPMAAEEEGQRVRIEIRPFDPPVPMTIALLYPAYGGRSRLAAAFGTCARAYIAQGWPKGVA